MKTETGDRCRRPSLGIIIVMVCVLAACAGDCDSHDVGQDMGPRDGAEGLDRQLSLDQQGTPEKKGGQDLARDQNKIVDQKLTPDQKGTPDQGGPDQAKTVDQKVAPDLKVVPDQTAALDKAAPPDQTAAPDQKGAQDQWVSPGKVPGTWKTIKAGTYKMGSPLSDKCRYANEPVQIPVTLTRSFQIQTTEVTQAQYAAVMGYNPAQAKACGAACAVELVRWHQAVAYCNALSAIGALTACYACSGSGTSVSCKGTAAAAGKGIYSCKGYRLPTEAEWEYAYRAGTSSAFYNGAITNCTGKDASADKIGWYYHNSGHKTHPVAQKLANAWGLYDMAGNVEEWCHDGYLKDLGATALADPVGPGTSCHVLRSGSWFGDPYLLRGAVRHCQAPTVKSNNIGFRCVRTMP